MYQIVATVVLCASSCAHADTYEELIRGFDLGSGVSWHLDQIRENVSVLESHALGVNYSGIGVRIEKASNKDVLEVGLYVDEETEGRRRKVGEVLLPTLLGFKVMGMAMMTLTGVALLVFKAVGIANLAIFVTAGLLIAKFLQNYHEKTAHGEIGPHPYQQPIYDEWPSAAGPSAAGSYLALNYGTTGVEGADSTAQYAIIETPVANESLVAVPAGKRRDHHKRKSQSVPFLALRKYTVET